MRARLATVVARLGVGNPDRIAFQITLIINGAYVTGLMAQADDLQGDLVDAVIKLLAQVDVTPAARETNCSWPSNSS